MEKPLLGGRYVIVVDVGLQTDWASWFGEFEVEVDGETTRLTGSITDQSALHGVIARLRDLGLPIITINRISEP